MTKTYDRLFSLLGRRPTEEEYEEYKKVYRRKVLTTRAFCRRHKISPDEFLKEMEVIPLEDLKSYSCKFSK